MNLHNWFTGKTILVCGAAGFIGSNLCHALYRLGTKVIGIDGMLPISGANSFNLREIANEITFIESPIEQVANLDDIVSETDLIVNCMGFTSHRIALENPSWDLQLNVGSSIALIEAVRRSGYRKVLVYLGSKSQYGALQSDSICENHPMNPTDVHGANKLAAEHYFRIYSQLVGFTLIVLRIPNCFGPRQKLAGDSGLVGAFVLTALLNEEIVVYDSNVPRRRDLIYVDDLVSAILLVASSASSSCTYNVSSYNLSITEIVRTIIAEAHSGSYRVQCIPEKTSLTDMTGVPLNCQRIRDDFGWTPSLSFEQAMKMTLEFVRTYGNNYRAPDTRHDQAL